MIELAGRFSLEELKQILERLEEEKRKKWEEEKKRALEILEKVTRAVEHKKPRKVLLTFEKRPSQKYLEKVKREIEEKGYPKWVLEIISQPKEVKKVVVLTRPIIIRRLLGEVKPAYSNVKFIELKGVVQEWHKALIVPEARNLLQDLRLTKENFREAKPIEVVEEGVKVTEYVAIPTYKPAPDKEPIGIGHIFIGDKPFLWTFFPVNAPRLAEATIKAILIWNYHDEPLKLTIVHMYHGTKDVVEVPPRSFFIFIHKFKEALATAERKEKVKEMLKRLEEMGISKELLKKLEKFYASHGWMLPEELHAKLAEEQARRIAYEQIKEIKQKLREIQREYLPV